MTRFAVVFALLAGCASLETGPDATTPQPEAWAPVASYPGFDDATGARIAAALESRGIGFAAVCSAGCTVDVAASRAAEARGLLAALLDEHVE